MTILTSTNSYVAPVPIPPVPPEFVYCDRAYGTGLTFVDASRAGGLLPQGTVPVTYTVEEPEMDDLALNVSALRMGYELPFLEFQGGVSLSVDVSGPLDIDRIAVAPNDIRGMAGWVARECVGRRGGLGGFVTKRIQGLVDFVTDTTKDIDEQPYPESTAFLTLMISDHEQSGTFPGDFDPQVAIVLRQAVVNAWTRAAPDHRSILAERIERFRKSELNMRRLGIEVAWWEGWQLQGNRTAVTNLQLANITSENVATARRRKRVARTLR